MASAKYLTRQSIEAWLEKASQANARLGMLPLHYEMDRGKLVLFGTDNIGGRDEHSLLRLAESDLLFEGAVEVRGHLAETGIQTRGEGANIRVTGYICGDSEKNPLRLVARDSAISLGDTNHPDRRTVMFAHIEASNGVTVYKRPLMFTTIISHYEDAVLRGQIMQNVKIVAPYVSLSASICKDMDIAARQDVVIKGGLVSRCRISVSDGEAMVCAGAIRECEINAEYDIDLTGCVDEYTLKHAKSEKGSVRYDGKPVPSAQQKRA